MSLWKRGQQYWLDVVVHRQRYREPLHTTDWREAKAREKERVVELSRRPADPAQRGRAYGALDVNAAIQAYASERRAQVSPRMVAYWTENARPLATFFDTTLLRNITPEQVAAYQNARIDAGRAPKTVNGELSVLRQVLRHARLWYRFQEDYRALRNTKPPVGQALTDDEQQRLFSAAVTRPAWTCAHVASTLAFYCGLRACEIKGLQWKHVDWEHRRIQIRRSKTPAGWRDPSLNEATARALRALHTRAADVGFDAAEHYLFPWHGRDKKLDPTRPMTSWRSAWRALRQAAGLEHVRFHDGRHTALTRLAENGQADWVIQAQMGHVSPAMMRTHSHIRRKALDEAAAALEPTFELPLPSHDASDAVAADRCDDVMSQSTSQSDDLDWIEALTEDLRDTLPKAGRPSKARAKRDTRQNLSARIHREGFGSSGWIRTCSARGAAERWIELEPARRSYDRTK
jgi:integrase